MILISSYEFLSASDMLRSPLFAFTLKGFGIRENIEAVLRI
jgi:hypothetical protein